MLRHHASLEEVLGRIFQARGLDRHRYETAVEPDEQGRVILWIRPKRNEPYEVDSLQRTEPYVVLFDSLQPMISEPKFHKATSPSLTWL